MQAVGELARLDRGQHLHAGRAAAGLGENQGARRDRLELEPAHAFFIVRIPDDQGGSGIDECSAIETNRIGGGEVIDGRAAPIGDIEVEHEPAAPLGITFKSDDGRKVVLEKCPREQEPRAPAIGIAGMLVPLNFLIDGANDTTGIVAIGIAFDGPRDLDLVFIGGT